MVLGVEAESALSDTLSFFLAICFCYITFVPQIACPSALFSTHKKHVRQMKSHWRLKEELKKWKKLLHY